jgi:hypothetical protein
MTSKIPYVTMRAMFDKMIDSALFSDEAKSLHQWEKEDFLVSLYEEIHAEYEEETYDIALEAPSSLQ